MTTTESPSPDAESTASDDAYFVETTLLDRLRLLNAASSALLTQAMLHSELLRVEWAEEKRRLLHILLALLLGYAALLGLLIFAGVLVLALNWDTAYRIYAIIALLIIYAGATFFAWRRVEHLAKQGERAFAASREELAADITLLRKKLCL